MAVKVISTTCHQASQVLQDAYSVVVVVYLKCLNRQIFEHVLLTAYVDLVQVIGMMMVLNQSTLV